MAPPKVNKRENASSTSFGLFNVISMYSVKQAQEDAVNVKMDETSTLDALAAMIPRACFAAAHTPPFLCPFFVCSCYAVAV